MRSRLVILFLVRNQGTKQYKRNHRPYYYPRKKNVLIDLYALILFLIRRVMFDYIHTHNIEKQSDCVNPIVFILLFSDNYLRIQTLFSCQINEILFRHQIPFINRFLNSFHKPSNQ